MTRRQEMAPAAREVESIFVLDRRLQPRAGFVPICEDPLVSPLAHETLMQLRKRERIVEQRCVDDGLQEGAFL